MAPLVAELGKAFEKKNSEARIEVQAGGSSKGITDCRDKLSDIGMVSRELNPEEKDLKAFAIAQDGLAFIVHTKNKTQNLTKEQVIGIYTGQITNWKQVGGGDEKITVVSKAEGRAALEFFLHYFKLKNSQIKAAVIIGDEEQGIKTVSSTPSAIAFLSVSSADIAEKNKGMVKSLSIDGVKANLANVKAKKYALARPLHLVTNGPPNELTQKFIAFISNPEGQALIEKLSYIPVR